MPLISSVKMIYISKGQRKVCNWDVSENLPWEGPGVRRKEAGLNFGQVQGEIKTVLINLVQVWTVMFKRLEKPDTHLNGPDVVVHAYKSSTLETGGPGV